jgi:GH15 family glucan-1,4-alpha-glucosidase
MGRPVMLSNGKLMVGLNEHGLVQDFYYPYVGLDNLTTARSVHHKIGVWVNGTFSWVDDSSWQIEVDLEPDALVGHVIMRSEKLAIELKFTDFVDNDHNLFCRYVSVANTGTEAREVRLFMHQVFEISRAGRADTALFVPDDNYILDYKGRCSLLIYGRQTDGTVFDQFAVGSYGIEGKEGTFRDAEDGELSGSAVEHGGVDSVLRFSMTIEPNQSKDVEYWIAAADSQFAAEKIHTLIAKEGLPARLQSVRQYWQEWLSIGSNSLHAVDREYIEPLKKSLMIIKAHTDRRGGIIASGDSSIYNYGRDYYSYVWPRDGAFALWPLIRLGYSEEAKRFFEFCRDIITPEGYLMHKYQPDRAIGSTWHPWLHGNHRELPIQEDETASVLYMLGEYLEYSKDVDFVKGLYLTFVQPAANFMAGFIDEATGLPHASYDLWEEKFLTNTYTTAIVYQALLVASDMAKEFEHPDDASKWAEVAEKLLTNSTVFFDPERGSLRKGFLLQSDSSLQYDNTLDLSSLYGVMMFGYSHGSTELKSTVKLVEDILLNSSPIGGSPRYENDQYFRSEPGYQGNPWVITTLWLAQYYIRIGEVDKGHQHIRWSIEKALASGALPEQVHPEAGSPVSVTPLVWSHAELANTILDIMKLG